jgi:hypothetical protein
MLKSEVKKNMIIIDPDFPGSRNTCDVREYEPGDDAALAAGRVFAHELPLDGAWTLIPEYEWGDQKALCYARWNKATNNIQIVNVHGYDEDLRLDSLGNLWEYHWNPSADRWDRRLVE